MKKLFLCLATLLALPSCHRTLVTSRRTLNLKKEAVTPQQPQKKTAPSVTVWIHGTRALKPLDTLIHAAPLKSSLQPLASLTDKYRLKKLARAISTTDPINYPFEHFYAFGWSGDLSFEARHKEAQRLYKQLEELIATYSKKYGHAPFIRLITHSHGGNVALNLATIKHTNKDWFINEAILLACPVQNKTKDLVVSPLFGKIYNLYSMIDSLQIADPQGLYKKENNLERKDLFSQRRFPDNKKLIQVNLRINNHGVSHLGFILSRFLKNLPSIIDYLNQWEQEAPHSSDSIRQLNLFI